MSDPTVYIITGTAVFRLAFWVFMGGALGAVVGILLADTLGKAVEKLFGKKGGAS